MLQEQPDLQVLVVWVPVLDADIRERAAQARALIPEARHFWDPSARTATWLYREGIRHWAPLRDRSPFRWGLAWDVFLLYGPEARWESAPTAPRASGATVIGQGEVLRQAVEKP